MLAATSALFNPHDLSNLSLSILQQKLYSQSSFSKTRQELDIYLRYISSSSENQVPPFPITGQKVALWIAYESNRKRWERIGDKTSDCFSSSHGSSDKVSLDTLKMKINQLDWCRSETLSVYEPFRSSFDSKSLGLESLWLSPEVNATFKAAEFQRKSPSASPSIFPSDESSRDSSPTDLVLEEDELADGSDSESSSSNSQSSSQKRTSCGKYSKRGKYKITVTRCQNFEKELKAWAAAQCVREGEPGWKEEREWLEEYNLMARFLRASKWQLELAKKRLGKAMIRRRQTFSSSSSSLEQQ